ncbi:hypothetical protein D3Z45_12070 [Lachnospiraceae bacterium]|nr:hypothetical protein [Lachnospiraceae bacterium]
MDSGSCRKLKKRKSGGVRGRSFEEAKGMRGGELSGREQIRCILEGIGIVFLLAWFFYQSVLALPFLTPVFLLYQKEKRNLLLKRRQKEGANQFKDAILSVSANQKAGYSVENAFRQAYGDMLLLYGRESIICKELYTIIAGLKNNVVLEQLLYDFGKRSGSEDIMEFAEVFAAAKRSGGNLTEVIERSAAVIEDKVETEKEIQVVISARRMEQKVMNVVPFGILLYISTVSKGFFHVLYKNVIGIAVMTVCLVVYLGAVWLSNKIVDIEV